MFRAPRALRGFGLCKEGPSLQAFRVGDLLLEAPGAKVYLIELGRTLASMVLYREAGIKLSLALCTILLNGCYG